MHVERHFALTTHVGGIVSAEPALAGWVLRGDRGRVFGWEVLTFVSLDGGQIAIRTAHGFYVSAQPEADDWMLRADRIIVQPWERFTPIVVDRYIVLRTAHDRFVTVGNPHEGWVLRGDGADLRAGERFGGGEVTPAPPFGAPDEAFAPFEVGGWTFRTPLITAMRAFGETTGRPSEGNGSQPPQGEAPERRFRSPIPGPAGNLFWF